MFARGYSASSGFPGTRIGFTCAFVGLFRNCLGSRIYCRCAPHSLRSSAPTMLPAWHDRRTVSMPTLDKVAVFPLEQAVK